MKRILTLLFLLPLFAIGQCDTVTGLTATGVGHASATISFTAPSASLYFVLIYNGTRQNINNPGGPYPALVTAPLNSLTPSTAYTYTIVRYCTGSDSAESSDYYFTTTVAPCDTVTNVAASVTSNSVSITSTAAAYGDSYVIYYVRDGQTDTTTEASADEDFQLANLRPNTVYWYQIGTICGSDTTRNTRRSFTTSNSPAYTPSYNFGWQYKRLAADSTLNIPTMNAASLKNGKNDKAAIIYDTTIGAPAIFDPLNQEWNYLSTQDSSIVVVATVAALSAYSGSVNTVIVTDSLRGGVFTYYSTGLTTDDGIVFDATGKGSGHWKRQITESDAVNVEWFVTTSGSDTAANTSMLVWLIDAGFKRIYVPDNIPVNYDSITDGKLANVSLIKGTSAITFGKSAVLGYPASNDTHLALQPLKKNKVTGLWISGKDPYPQAPDVTGTYNTLKIGWEDLEKQLEAGTGHYGNFGLTLQKDGFNGFGAVRFNTKGTGDFTGDWPSMEFAFQNNSPTYKAMTVALLKPIANADGTGLGYNYGGRDKAFWYAGRPTTSGQYILVNYNVYKATTSGTTGNTKPVHTSGTVSDGGISWQWIENVAPNVTGVNWRPAVIFGATNSFTTVPFNRASVHFAERALVYPQQGFDFINGSKNAVLGSIEALSQTTKGLKLIADSATDKYISISDTMVKLNNVPLVPTILAKPSGDTTFSIATGDVVAFNDATNTDFKRFTGGITGQRIIVNFNTANTNLIESSDLKLNGAGSINPPPNSAAEFYVESNTSVRLIGLASAADTSACGASFIDIDGNVQDNASLDSALATKIMGLGVAQRMAFWNGTNSLSSGANIFIDSVNNRIGVLTNVPTHTLTFGQGNTGIVNYVTIDQVTNFERFRSYWNSNVWTMATDAGGTGTNRPIAFSANGSVFTMGHPSNGFEFSRNGANIGSIVNIGSSTGNALTGSSGVQSGLQIDPTVSQTGTAGYNGLYISPFENSTGSGSKLLIDAGTNSAAQNGGTHTSKFVVDNAGSIITANTATGGHTFYNTADQVTNFERFRAYWNGNSFVMGTDFGGTGVSRNIVLSASSSLFTIGGGTSMFQFSRGASTTDIVNIGTNGTTAFSSSSLIQNMLKIDGAVAQSGTAGYRGLFMSPFEGTLGSGVKYLIDAGVNSAANSGGTHTSRFIVDNLGNMITPSSATSGHTFYNTTDQVTNYERGFLRYNSNVLELGTEYDGTASVRTLRLGIGSSAGSPMTNGRKFEISGSAPMFLLSHGSTGLTGNLSSITGTYQASSGTQTMLAITPTISQTGTASYEGLVVNATETSTGSGSKTLMRLAVGGTSRFIIDNNGATTMSSALFLTNTTGVGYIQLANGTTPSTPTSAIRLYSNAGGLSFVNASGNVMSLFASTGTANFTIPSGTNTAATLSGAEVLTNKTISGASNTLGDIPSTALTTPAARGYTLQATHAGVNYAASTIYYFGSMGGNTTTTAQRNKIYIPANGTIKKAYVSYFVGGTLASTEAITFAIRHNNTTDYTVSNTAKLDAAIVDFNSTSLNIAVAAGDFIEMKVTTPAFVTAPTTVRCSVVLFVE